MAHRPRVLLLLGSVRPGRMCDRAAKFIETYLVKSGFDTDILDPAVLNLPLLETPLHFFPDVKDIPKVLVDTNSKIASADAYVVVSAEYNHSIPPALSNLMDHFPQASYEHKPCAIVCYSMGSTGGVRAAMQLRALLSELGTISLPVMCPIPLIHLTLDENGVTTDEALVGVALKMVEQLKWYATATKNKRGHVIPNKVQHAPSSGPCCQS